MSSLPRVSVIIVSWNARPLLELCLPSVVATEYPDFEVILADNASTDDSVAWVRAHHPEVRVVRHPENWAFARGNNAALPHATGSIVVFLNNDVEVPPGWLHPLVEALTHDDSLAAVQPKLLQHGDRQRFEYAGAAGGYLDRYGYPFARGRLLYALEEDAGQYDDRRAIFWATGAAFAVKRSVLDEVGLFDEAFEMHMEEIDLCWRMHRRGYRIEVVPASTVFHIGGASLPQGSPRKAYYNYRNSLLMLYKNLPPAAWWRIFPVRALLDGSALLRALLTGRLQEAGAIARAFADAHRMKERYEAERPGPDDPAVLPTYRGSIVLDYFLRGRRRFSELPDDLFATAMTPAGTAA